MPDKARKFCSTLLTLRALLLTFIVSSFSVVTYNCVTSIWRSSIPIGVPMLIKVDSSNIFRNSMDFGKTQPVNGTTKGTVVIQPVGKHRTSKGYGFILRINDKVKFKRLTGTSKVTENSQRRLTTTNAITEPHFILGNTISIGDSDNKRKDNCNNCFCHNFKYVIDNPDICKLHSGKTEIELLIIILTVHKNVQQRNALRETWLAYTKNNTANVRYVFLLGDVNDTKLKKDIVKENQVYKDIIKEDFVDVYSNLTYKTIMGFKWAATKCGVTKAVLKTDDDMYINVPNVLGIVRNYYSTLLTNIVGHCHQRAKPIRDRKSKWYASKHSYPMEFYPGFCSGTGYLTSLNITRKVFEISPHVPYFHLEDVYVALCIKKLGYHLKRFPGFHPDHPTLNACVYNGKSLVTAHYMTPEMIRQMWNAKCIGKSSQNKG